MPIKTNLENLNLDNINSQRQNTEVAQVETIEYELASSKSSEEKEVETEEMDLNMEANSSNTSCYDMNEIIHKVEMEDPSLVEDVQGLFEGKDETKLELRTTLFLLGVKVNIEDIVSYTEKETEEGVRYVIYFRNGTRLSLKDNNDGTEYVSYIVDTNNNYYYYDESGNCIKTKNNLGIEREISKEKVNKIRTAISEIETDKNSLISQYEYKEGFSLEDLWNKEEREKASELLRERNIIVSSEKIDSMNGSLIELTNGVRIKLFETFFVIEPPYDGNSYYYDEEGICDYVHLSDGSRINYEEGIASRIKFVDGEKLDFSQTLHIIKSIAEESQMPCSEIEKIYNIVTNNKMTLEYGTLTADDGWWKKGTYMGEDSYTGLYASWIGKSGISYKIPLLKMEIIEDSYTEYSKYDNDELVHFIEAVSDYTQAFEICISENLTDFFIESSINKLPEDKNGNPVVCIVNYGGRWNGISSSGVCIDGHNIMKNYDPENGKIFTIDSRNIGTLIHELGHQLDKNLKNEQGQWLTSQKPWQEIYPTLLNYMQFLNLQRSERERINLIEIGETPLSRIAYSDRIVAPNYDPVEDNLDYEIFTEMSRIYYQEPAALQGVEIDYTDSISGIHYDNLYDFMDDVQNGRIQIR